MGTRLALLRKSRRNQEVQARRNMPAGVVPLEGQEQTEEAMDEDMELEPAADIALAEQADLALAQQQQQQTDREMDQHATRLAAGIPGMLAHLPVRTEALLTPILEAFLDREEGGEEEGEEEEQETQ